MTLQLALDGAEKGRTLDEAMGLARAARQYTDIIEVGTSFVLRDGLAAVKKFARAGFGVPILADVKIMDCGVGLCAMACEAGADIVTVMAFAADKTIEGVVREAHTRGRRVMADLLGMQNAAAAAQRVHALGGRSGILHAEQVCHHAAPARMRLAHNPLYGLISGEGHHGHDVCPCLARHGAQADAAVHDLHIGKNGHAEARARKFFHSGKAVAQHKAGAHLYNIRILPRRSRKAHGLVQRAPLLCAVQRQLQRHMRRLLP